MKVLKNALGKVVAYGPNSDNYEPNVPAGHTLEVIPGYAPEVDLAEVAKLEIAQLEQSTMLPRVTREFMLLSMAGQLTPAQLALHAGYQKLKAFDDQIKLLRAKL